MAKVFKSNSDKRVLDIVQETLDVGADGSVSFRGSDGKGCGRAVKIPSDEFDNFVKLMNETASRRTTLAAQASAQTSTDNE